MAFPHKSRLKQECHSDTSTRLADANAQTVRVPMLLSLDTPAHRQQFSLILPPEASILLPKFTARLGSHFADDIARDPADFERQVVLHTPPGTQVHDPAR